MTGACVTDVDEAATGPTSEPARLEVDGEVFLVWRGEHGGTHYDWVSGPNEGYGFSSSRTWDKPALHAREIRTFLSAVDPDTGYIEY